MIGYRTEQLYGEGFRDAASVMAHEVFELQNTDILDTLSETILKNNRWGEELRCMSGCMRDEIDDGWMENYLNQVYDDDKKGVEFFNFILSAIKEETGKDIKYALWLCDSIYDIVTNYDHDDLSTLNEFDIYETSDIVLSNIGCAGKLYGYEDLPVKLNK